MLLCRKAIILILLIFKGPLCILGGQPMNKLSLWDQWENMIKKNMIKKKRKEVGLKVVILEVSGRAIAGVFLDLIAS